MDAATFTAIRLNEKRAADLEREVAHLAAHRERLAALGDATPKPAHRGLWTRVTHRRPAAAPAASCEQAGLALAGSSA